MGSTCTLASCRGPVVHGDAAHDVLGRGLRVLHLDVEVPALVEDAGVDELVFELVPRPRPVHRHQVVVRELGLRVLVQPALVAVRRQVIDVEVVLLDVFPVVALGIGEAEQPLLEDRVLLVPQRQRQAQPLLVVADPGETVLAPPVRAGPRLIMTEVRPGIPVLAVVLPDRAPLPFAEIRPPGAPRHAFPGLPEPEFLCGKPRGTADGRPPTTIGHIAIPSPPSDISRLSHGYTSGVAAGHRLMTPGPS